jgi:hypothetical protein
MGIHDDHAVLIQRNDFPNVVGELLLDQHRDPSIILECAQLNEIAYSLLGQLVQAQQVKNNKAVALGLRHHRQLAPQLEPAFVLSVRKAVFLYAFGQCSKDGGAGLRQELFLQGVFEYDFEEHAAGIVHQIFIFGLGLYAELIPQNLHHLS